MAGEMSNLRNSKMIDTTWTGPLKQHDIKRMLFLQRDALTGATNARISRMKERNTMTMSMQSESFPRL